jgi:putative SOS response-associated peptidase YedK
MSLLDAISKYFELELRDLSWTPKANISPSSKIVAIVFDEKKGKILDTKVWGLVPYWSKEGKIKFNTINARAENIETTPAYKIPFKKQRTLIIADGFYEWKNIEGKKYPFRFVLKSKGLFAFAGVWDQWLSPDKTKSIDSCSIITTRANQLVSPIHDRMPVILHPDQYDLWLNPKNQDTEKLKSLLIPFPAEEMEVYPVSPLLNNPRNESSDLIKPIPPDENGSK